MATLPKIIAALAVNTRSGMPATGSRQSIVAPACSSSRRRSCHWVIASWRSAPWRRSIQGLISYSMP